MSGPRSGRIEPRPIEQSTDAEQRCMGALCPKSSVRHTASRAAQLPVTPFPIPDLRIADHLDRIATSAVGAFSTLVAADSSHATKGFGDDSCPTFASVILEPPRYAAKRRHPGFQRGKTPPRNAVQPSGCHHFVQVWRGTDRC